MLIRPTFLAGDYRFAGNQVSSFSEVAYTSKRNKNVLISGLNYYSDYFEEIPIQNNMLRNEALQTIGAFANYVFDIGQKISIESGLRSDYVFEQKLHVLPRVSALFKWTNQLSTRIGGWLGYRNASIFNQEAELYRAKCLIQLGRKKEVKTALEEIIMKGGFYVEDAIALKSKINLWFAAIGAI